VMAKAWLSLYHRTILEVRDDLPEPAVPVIKIASKTIQIQ
jgi:hypothetical protein